MIRLGKHTERQEVVYHMMADEYIGEVDVYEIADVMCAFGDVVQEALKATGHDGTLKVNVKPFKEGSFITEFVLTYGGDAVSLFNTPEVNALANIVTILGFSGISAHTLPKVIRKVSGHINEFRDNGDGTYTYGKGDDALTVGSDVHAVVQSPKVAKPYKRTVIGPLVNIDKSINVTIQSKEDSVKGESQAGTTFTSADEASLSMYEHVAVDGVPEEHEETTTVSHGIMLSPIKGPYDGGENGYTFKSGDNTYRSVQIHDLEFRMKLESGKVRFMNRDVLKADLQVTQSVARNGSISNSYMILKVHDYRPYEPPDQASIDDYLGD